MASDNLDISQIAVVIVPDDCNPSSSALTLPSPSLDGSRLPSPSPADFHGLLSPPTPILRSARNFLDFGSLSRTSSDSSLSPPPPLTLTARSSGPIRSKNPTFFRENNPEDHDVCLAPPPHGHRQKCRVGAVSSITSSSTECDVEDNSSFTLSPLHPARVLTASPLVLNDGSPANSKPPIKKKRKRADARQLEALNRMYAHTAFPSTEERQQLTRDLDMSPRSVQIWLVHAFVITCRISELLAILSGSRTKGRRAVKPAKDNVVLILPTFSPLCGKGNTTIRLLCAF